MNRNLFFYFLTLFFLGASCTSSHERTFEDLNAQERKMLQKELMDSLRGEMVEYMENVDEFYRNTEPMCVLPPLDFRVKLNKNSEVMIQDEIKKGILFSRLFHYFNTSRLVNKPEKTCALYLDVSKKSIQENIRSEKEFLKNLDQARHREYVDFKKQSISEHQDQLETLELLKITQIRVIDSYRVNISYYAEIPGQETYVDSVLNTVIEVRNNLSKKYLHRSYLEQFYLRKIYPTRENKLKLSFLKWCIPLYVYDKTYAKQNDLLDSWIDLPLPSQL